MFSKQLTYVSGQDTDSRKGDWWRNRALSESLELSAMAWQVDLALGGQVVSVYLMAGEEGVQSVRRKSLAAAMLILWDLCTWNHPAESTQRVFQVLYTTGHGVPPMHSVAIPRLYLVKMLILSQLMFSSRGEQVLLWRWERQRLYGGWDTKMHVGLSNQVNIASSSSVLQRK